MCRCSPSSRKAIRWQQYLDSLDKFAGLPADTLVLPSHGKPFRGLHTRIAQLREHHAARLAEVVEACARRRSRPPTSFRSCSGASSTPTS